MHTPNADWVVDDLCRTAMYFADNGYAVLAPIAVAMSHNRRTLQDVGAWPACIASERRLTQKNGGPA